MADDKAKRTVTVQGTELTQHLDRDPNDPRRAQLFNRAKANLSDLNKEDPEKDSEFQNPVK